MERRPTSLRRRLIAATFTATLPAVALAQPVIDHFQIAFGGPPGLTAAHPGAPMPRAPGDDGPRPRGDPPGARGSPFDAGMPKLPLLRGLELSEAQQDKVFAVLHALAPPLREKSKAVRNARDELESLVRSVDFDPATARQFAQTLARAQADIALLHAGAEHEIYMTLTTEQRRQVADAPKPRHGPGPRP